MSDPRASTPIPTSNDANVVLVGFMGTGKSTVGRALAQMLGRVFVDTDDEIEALHGPVPAIFAEHGEDGFREREREVIRQIAARRGQIVATGGGVVLDPANVADLAASGRIFCLDATADEIVRRVLSDPDAVERPLLSSHDPAARVRALLSERADRYGAFPRISTDGREPPAIAGQIAGLLGLPSPAPASRIIAEESNPMSARRSDAPLLSPFFLERTSTRSFTDQPVSEQELAAMFEAARWTPSWFNNQPWLFVYASDGPDRDALLGVLVEGNRWWAEAAPVVGLVLARTELEGFMGRSRDFDVGAATMAMTMQATMLGLSVHVLGGIDIDAAFELTGANRATTEIICGFVIGRRGDGSELPEKYQQREEPSDRKPVAAFAYRGATLPPELRG